MADRKHKHVDTRTNLSDAEMAASQPEGAEEEVISGVRESEKAKAVTAEELDEVQGQLDEARAKAREYFDGWQRERADFANYKRRIDREQLNLSQNIAAEVIKKYLLVLDDLDRAMKLRPNQGEMSAWADGIDLIYRKLQNILDAEGIKRIPAENEEFNPLRHEAISIEDSPDHNSGEVIGVVQEGYTLGDRVLRPARVRVAR